MAMTIGAVAIADDGTVTKSGLAGAMFDAVQAHYASIYDGAPLAQVINMKRASSGFTTALAAAIVPYIQANATATVTTSTSLQRLPTSLSAGEPTAAPLVAVELGIS